MVHISLIDSKVSSNFGLYIIVRDKGFDWGFWICFCCDFMVIQLYPTAEPKDCIYSVACEV